MTREDLLRARAIEMIMCDFRMDRSALRAAFGDTSRSLDLLIAQVAAQFGDFVDVTEEALEIRPSGQPLTRIIASAFDAYTQDAVRYSQAS